MRSLLVVVALSTLASAQTFRSTIDQVAVPVTIHSELNEPIADLRRDDFRVFDDGRPVSIVAFGKIQQPAHVLLLLDTSRSMLESLSAVRSAANAVIAGLGPDDTVQVGTFSSVLRLSPPFAADDHQLAARVPLAPGANMTILFDALVEGCTVFTGDRNRRAIFVVSDGTDTASSASARTVMQRAAETSVAIYAVGLSKRSSARGSPIVRAPDPVLREIAEDTGGGYVYAGTGRDFSRLFAPLLEELHEQYMLGFTPAQADGRLHSLVVTLRRPHMSLRARRHYLAPVP